VVSSLGKVLDVHVFQDEAGITGHVLQNLTQVSKMLETRPIQVESDEMQSGVYPEGQAEDASQLLRLFLFPNSVNVNNLDIDNVQVCITFSMPLLRGIIPRKSLGTKLV
jgi:hypothetical protein